MDTTRTKPGSRRGSPMAEHDNDSDDAGAYKLSKSEPTKRRYVPMKGFKASSEQEPDEFDKPVLNRLLGMDPFPWALAVCVLLWVGLGLAARTHPIFCGILIFAGLIICLLSQIWLYLSIFQDDATSGILSLISGWYRFIYLYANPELVWRPSILAAVGVLMCFTGMGMLMTKPWVH